MYSVGAAAWAVRGAGYLVGYAGTTPQSPETVDVMLAEFRRLSSGVSAATDAPVRAAAKLILQGEASGPRRGLAGSADGAGPSLGDRCSLRAISLDELNSWLLGSVSKSRPSSPRSGGNGHDQ